MGLVVLSPLLMAVGLFVRFRLGSPVLFRQARAGLGAEPFELVKFRSMTDVRGADGSLLPDVDRLIPFGERLRRLSLDELPELWLVLKGDMSLVGPRPLPVKYLDRYTPEQMRRHEVKPGITGWAQVNGRNATTWDERLAMDVWYVDNRSLWLDLKILWRTVAVVFSREGISA
ncbi:MAG: sugar transferase, partial [Acidimicrobiales bacterium]|nr:sugar transferase [Acidimicrobiales bacterium]